MITSYGWTRSAAQLRAEQRQHVVRIGVAAEHRLGEDELAVDMDVEDPAVAGHHFDGTDGLFPFLEDSGRQTGGLR